MGKTPADRLRRELSASAALVAVAAVLPAFVRSDYWLGVLVVGFYFTLQAMGWNLIAGYTGLFALAPATFAMLGAYGSALLNFHWQWPPALTIPVGIVTSTVAGFLLGWVTLRLRGPYLALTTLAFAEIARLVAINTPELTRGDLGLSVSGLWVHQRLYAYYFFLGLVAAVQAGLYVLLRSPVGLYLQAVRDDELGAEARGIDAARWKTLAFTLSSAICGLAGAFYVHFIQLATPEMGLVLNTALVISMVVVGGMGTLVGPLVGAPLVQVASEALRRVGVQHMLVFAALVILFGRFFRDGLWGLALRWWERPYPQPPGPALATAATSATARTAQEGSSRAAHRGPA